MAKIGTNDGRTRALVLGEPPVRLWGLSAGERIRRQLAALDPAITRIESIAELPAGSRVLLLSGEYLFDARALEDLLVRPGVALIDPGRERVAAAHVDGVHAAVVAGAVGSPASALPDGIVALRPGEIGAFDEALRSARPPLLERITAGRRTELENLLYGNAYRGITDLVTKYLWPRPARAAVQLCARWGLSPNAVTTLGFVLVLAACWLFWQGHFLAGLAAGWLMTFLDTVDGKLARVTVQSSRFGHFFDHAIDLLHPPFWYVCWGLAAGPFDPVLGLDFRGMCVVLVTAYVGGRVVEGLFSLLGECSVFTWRPFDAWFRLVTARRNPCLILLTASALAGRPDWGFIAVVAWSALTSIVLAVRLLQGVASRLADGPLRSWLQQDGAATGPHARSFRVFAGTRSAYGG